MGWEWEITTEVYWADDLDEEPHKCIRGWEPIGMSMVELDDPNDSRKTKTAVRVLYRRARPARPEPEGS